MPCKCLLENRLLESAANGYTLVPTWLSADPREVVGVDKIFTRGIESILQVPGEVPYSYENTHTHTDTDTHTHTHTRTCSQYVHTSS